MDTIEFNQIFFKLFFVSKQRKGIIYISETNSTFAYFWENFFFMVSHKILACAGPSGDPMAIPPICL